MEQFLKDAKDASNIISTLSGAIKNKVLNKMADALIENIEFIEEENKKDIEGFQTLMLVLPLFLILPVALLSYFFNNAGGIFSMISNVDNVKIHLLSK